MFFRMVYKSGPIFLPFCHNPRVWQTDGRTDRNLITIPCLHYMQRGKNTATGCHYLLPCLWLPTQPQDITTCRPIPNYTTWWQRHQVPIICLLVVVVV